MTSRISTWSDLCSRKASTVLQEKSIVIAQYWISLQVLHFPACQSPGWEGAALRIAFMIVIENSYSEEKIYDCSLGNDSFQCIWWTLIERFTLGATCTFVVIEDTTCHCVLIFHVRVGSKLYQDLKDSTPRSRSGWFLSRTGLQRGLDFLIFSPSVPDMSTRGCARAAPTSVVKAERYVYTVTSRRRSADIASNERTCLQGSRWSSHQKIGKMAKQKNKNPAIHSPNSIPAFAGMLWPISTAIKPAAITHPKNKTQHSSEKYSNQTTESTDTSLFFRGLKLGMGSVLVSVWNNWYRGRAIPRSIQILHL